MIKLKQEVAEHFFGKNVVRSALLNPNKTFNLEKPTVKIKYHDVKLKVDIIATVLEVTAEEWLRVVIDGPNAPVIEVIDPKTVSGVFITMLGREVELSFGVGKVSTTSLINEGGY